jgi:multimeric flavodoxin WrbA
VKVLAVNGSPRKAWNTATLLQSALDGAASRGAQTELVHLYDLDFKGCISCFACKTRQGTSYGRCAFSDGLTPLLHAIESADALIVGSPIYFGALSGETRCFVERLVFPYLVYSDPPQTLYTGNMRVGCIYTMNMPSAEVMQTWGVADHLAAGERTLARVFGNCESLASFDTYQFRDYGKVVADRFDETAKARRRDEEFPKDCERAFEMGLGLASGE